MQQTNHSELRHRILSSLKLEPTDSVTSLAQKLEVLRPSISRAVKLLEDSGYVTRTGRSITLSLSGQQELQKLDEALSMKVLKNMVSATRVFGHAFETVKQFGALTQNLRPVFDASAVRAMQELASLPSLQIHHALTDSSLLKAVGALQDNSFLQAVGSLKDNSVFQAAETFKATALIQATNLDLLKGWEVEIPSPISHLISDNNLILGTMLSDLEAFTNLRTSIDQALGGLVNQTLWTTKAYDEYFLDAVKSISMMPSLNDLELSVALPTQSVASLVGTTRTIVESEIGIPGGGVTIRSIEARTPLYHKQYQAVSRLETYLEPLGRRFINKWKGAWQAFHSESVDRHSQATHSGRELLMQVLEFLAPDNVFTQEDLAKHNSKHPTRKMRIEHILKGNHSSTVELINNMAKTLDSMYHVLVGETHRRDNDNRLDATIAGMLGALEDLLIMLLSMREIES